jgi:hypothetical protein
LAWIQSQPHQCCIFLTAARSQVRFNVSIRIIVSRSCWQSWTSSLAVFFISAWLSLFYHHDWKVGREVSSVGTKVLLPSDDVAWPRECVYWSSTTDHIPPMWIALIYPWTSSCSQNFHPLLEEKIPYVRFLPSFDQESSILPYRLAASCNCWFFIAKAYQVIPCLITSWSLIFLPSLKPIPDFVHLNSLVICASSVHCMARRHVTSLFGFVMWVTSLVRPPLLILGVLAYPWTQFPWPCVTALSLKRRHHEQAFSWRPRKLCQIPCPEKLNRRFTFDWLTSCPDYNPTLNCAGSSRRFSSQDLQDGTCHSFLEWQENWI